MCFYYGRKLDYLEIYKRIHGPDPGIKPLVGNLVFVIATRTWGKAMQTWGEKCKPVSPTMSCNKLPLSISVIPLQLF